MGVIVPADLEAGDYILSWRWDTEEFAQVWTSCSQIRITNGGPTPAPTPPTPPAPTPTPAPTPAGFTCDQCEAQGYGKDACNCGVCGSFGACTFSCSAGAGR